MHIAAMIFDLDGTLLDTLEDIAHSANQALEEASLPPHPVSEFRQLVGEGVARLFEKAIADQPRKRELVDDCLRRFSDVYRDNWKSRTRPYSGVTELIDQLVAERLPLGVLSNKPDEFTRLCVEHYFPAQPFRLIWGQGGGRPPKPDPTGARDMASQMGVPVESIAYVGDTNVDMQTAVGAGMIPVGVTWGFREAAELRSAGAVRLVDRPQDLWDWYHELQRGRN